MTKNATVAAQLADIAAHPRPGDCAVASRLWPCLREARRFLPREDFTVVAVDGYTVCIAQRDAEPGWITLGWWREIARHALRLSRQEGT